MKGIVVKSEKKVSSPDEFIIQVDNLSVPRNLTLQKLSKLVRLNTYDALLWNTNNLCRTFRIPPLHCEHLVKYVKPLIYLVNNKQPDPQKLLKTAKVIDVAKLKDDKSYFVAYQTVVFPDKHNGDIKQLD